MGVLASAVALSLGGLICRGRYRPLGLYVWLLILLAVVWLVIAAPFFLFALMTSGGTDWVERIHCSRSGGGDGQFRDLLPFLILSSASPFYRERLKALLQLEPETPPVMAPLPDASLKT